MRVEVPRGTNSRMALRDNNREFSFHVVTQYARNVLLIVISMRNLQNSELNARNVRWKAWEKV